MSSWLSISPSNSRTPAHHSMRIWTTTSLASTCSSISKSLAWTRTRSELGHLIRYYRRRGLGDILTEHWTSDDVDDNSWNDRGRVGTDETLTLTSKAPETLQLQRVIDHTTTLNKQPNGAGHLFFWLLNTMTINSYRLAGQSLLTNTSVPNPFGVFSSQFITELGHHAPDQLLKTKTNGVGVGVEEKRCRFQQNPVQSPRMSSSLFNLSHHRPRYLFPRRQCTLPGSYRACI